MLGLSPPIDITAGFSKGSSSEHLRTSSHKPKRWTKPRHKLTKHNLAKHKLTAQQQQNHSVSTELRVVSPVGTSVLVSAVLHQGAILHLTGANSTTAFFKSKIKLSDWTRSAQMSQRPPCLLIWRFWWDSLGLSCTFGVYALFWCGHAPCHKKSARSVIRTQVRTVL